MDILTLGRRLWSSAPIHKLFGRCCASAEGKVTQYAFLHLCWGGNYCRGLEGGLSGRCEVMASMIVLVRYVCGRGDYYLL